MDYIRRNQNTKPNRNKNNIRKTLYCSTGNIKWTCPFACSEKFAGFHHTSITINEEIWGPHVVLKRSNWDVWVPQGSRQAKDYGQQIIPSHSQIWKYWQRFQKQEMKWATVFTHDGMNFVNDFNEQNKNKSAPHTTR